MQITLERRFFVTNDAGSDEFDWLLEMLNVEESKKSDLDTVEIELVGVDVTIDGETATVS